jgi:hypothetical protein
MILIAHRGNFKGRNPEKENNPDYIKDAVERGYYVEVDVWVNNGIFYLGHDEPQWRVDVDFLRNPKLICHSKNIEAFQWYAQCWGHSLLLASNRLLRPNV